MVGDPQPGFGSGLHVRSIRASVRAQRAVLLAGFNQGQFPSTKLNYWRGVGSRTLSSTTNRCPSRGNQRETCGYVFLEGSPVWLV